MFEKDVPIQFSVIRSKFWIFLTEMLVMLCLCFSVAMGDRRFLCWVKQWSEVTKKILINSGFVQFRWKAGLLRSWFYYCQCVVASNAKEIYRFKVRVLKRFFCKAWVRLEFLITDFWWPWRKKYPEKVTAATIQPIINLYMFRSEFLVKKHDFWRAVVF